MSNTILLVEDDLPTCALWERHLTHNGWDVQIATSGAEAEEAVLKYRPLALVLDIILTNEYTGWDFLDTLHTWDWTRTVPVIIVSALDVRQRALEEGAVACLLKPCSPAAVVAKVTEALVLESSAPTA